MWLVCIICGGTVNSDGWCPDCEYPSRVATSFNGRTIDSDSMNGSSTLPVVAISLDKVSSAVLT